MKIGKSLKDKEFIHDKNFAPKQNERDCPITVIFITGQVESGLLGSVPMYKKTLETLEVNSEVSGVF